MPIDADKSEALHRVASVFQALELPRNPGLELWDAHANRAARTWVTARV